MSSRAGGPELSLVVACALSPFSGAPEPLMRFQEVATLWDAAAPEDLVESFRDVLPYEIPANEEAFEVFDSYLEHLRNGSTM